MNEFSIRSAIPIFKFLKGSEQALSRVLLKADPFRIVVSVRSVSGYGDGEGSCFIDGRSVSPAARCRGGPLGNNGLGKVK